MTSDDLMRQIEETERLIAVYLDVRDERDTSLTGLLKWDRLRMF
jgi:hypothetical protein